MIHCGSAGAQTFHRLFDFNIQKNLLPLTLCNEAITIYIIYAHVPYLSKCLIEPHLLSQYTDIVEKVRLHVAPHVWKPPEVSLVLQQHVITLILLISP